MVEPSDKRVDLSDVHPAKRLMLVVFRFVFCMGLAFAICSQFAWTSGALYTPMGHLKMAANRVGLTSIMQASQSNGWSQRCHCGGYYEEYSAFIPWNVDDYSYEYLFVSNEPLVPGFYWIVGWKSYSIAINHFWVIGITATLYLFARWLIRRSAERQKLSS